MPKRAKQLFEIPYLMMVGGIRSITIKFEDEASGNGDILVVHTETEDGECGRTTNLEWPADNRDPAYIAFEKAMRDHLKC